MKNKRLRMNYKTANTLSAVLSVAGLVTAGCLYLFEDVGAGFTVVAVLAFALIAGGLAVKLIFYRCVNCGALLPLRTMVTPTYCPYCGGKLS